MGDALTLTLDEEVIDLLRLAALERCWGERAEAEALGRRKMKRCAEYSAGRAQKFMHAVQRLDQALGRSVPGEDPTPSVSLHPGDLGLGGGR